MILDKLWEIVILLHTHVKKLWRKESKPTKEVKKITTTPLLISKPKFKVGDVVKHKDGSYWEIDEYSYDPKKKEWQYTMKIFDRKFYESELELVEDEKGEANV